MTTRIRSITVAFEEDIRPEEVECLVNTIEMMRNVLSVTTNEVIPNDWATERRVKLKTAQKLNNLVNNLVIELYTN